MILSKKDIEKIVKDGDTGEFSHVIICVDRWDYDYFAKYVEHGEKPQEVIQDVLSHGSPGMFGIEEVYNYNLDIDMQLNEFRSYHIEPLERKIKKDNPDSLPDRALMYAKKMHEGQYRKNGSLYIEHPINVAKYVAQFKQSKNMDALLASAYLHDVIEDTDATYYDVADNFGSEIAGLVKELTTDTDFKRELGKTRYLEIKMKNMSSWALVIKLCDRLDNISDLEDCNKDFRDKYVNETIEIMNYLLDNRELSNTQLVIIKEISSRLNSLIKMFYSLDELDINKLNKKILLLEK